MVVGGHLVYLRSFLTVLDYCVLQIGLLDHPSPSQFDYGYAMIAEPDLSVEARIFPVPVVGVAWSV